MHTGLSYGYDPGSIRARLSGHPGRHIYPGKTLHSQPFPTDHEMNIQAEFSIRAGLSWQTNVSRHLDIFAKKHCMRHSGCFYDIGIYVFLSNLISHVSSGQTVEWEMNVH
jgi:hypothetical protein